MFSMSSAFCYYLYHKLSIILCDSITNGVQLSTLCNSMSTSSAI